MKIYPISLIAAFAFTVGLFLRSDCDLLLHLLPPIKAAAFAGQVVWITGASSGIGASLAYDYAAAGAQVVISARRVEQLEEVAARCGRVGLVPMIVPLDVTQLDEHESATAKILQRFKQIDVLILNAGRSQRNLALETSLSDTRSLMELNFFSIVSLTKTVVPHMTTRRAGQIVVMSSLSGKMGTPVASSYSATKFALHGYFDALRAEIVQDNVSVHMVCPGPVESEIAEHMFRNEANPEQAEGKKMTTARCTELIVKGLYYKFDEMWISDQPYLLTTYLATYTPWVMRQVMTKLAGPGRVRALKEGTNIFDASAILGLKK